MSFLRTGRALLRRLLAATCVRAAGWFAHRETGWLLACHNALLRQAGIRAPEPFFADRGFRCLYPGNITLGRHVSLGHDNHIWAFLPVRIGAYTQTAKDLLIIAGSHDVNTLEPLAGQDVVIGPGCWIGARVTIIGGVTIGRGCVIGAGAVVRGNLPDWSVAAGVPARVIRTRAPAPRMFNPFGHYTHADLDGAGG